MVFDRAMDKPTVLAAFRLYKQLPTPVQVSGTASWPDDRTFVFRPDQRLDSLSDYRATLSADALSSDGLRLASSAEWMFQTVRSAQIAAYSPTGTGVATSARPTISFADIMHRESVKNAFSINPAVTGQLAWTTPYEVQFVPRTALRAGVLYTVRLGASARSLASTRALEPVTLISPFEWQFRTQAAAAAANQPTALSAVATGAGAVTISFTLAAEADVQVRVVNLAGRTVACLTPAAMGSAGVNTLLWNGLSQSGTRVPSGTYLVTVLVRDAAGGQSQTLAPLQLR